MKSRDLLRLFLAILALFALASAASLATAAITNSRVAAWAVYFVALVVVVFGSFIVARRKGWGRAAQVNIHPLFWVAFIAVSATSALSQMGHRPLSWIGTALSIVLLIYVFRQSRAAERGHN